MHTTVSRIAALFVLATASLAASAQNLVQDPSFDSPGAYDAGSDSYDMSAAWTATGFERIYKNSPSYPDQASHSSDYFAALGSGNAGGVLSQSLTTKANRTYTVSFYLQNYDLFPGTSNSLAVGFGDGSLTLKNVAESSGYTMYSFVGKASGTSTTLSFTESNPNDYFFLDDVSVVANPVPEPASMAALGLGVLALIRRRKA